MGVCVGDGMDLGVLDSRLMCIAHAHTYSKHMKKLGAGEPVGGDADHGARLGPRLRSVARLYIYIHVLLCPNTPPNNNDSTLYVITNPQKAPAASVRPSSSGTFGGPAR